MKTKLPSSYELYLALVSAVGLGLLCWSLLDLIQPEQPLALALLILLAIVSQYLTSSAIPSSDGRRITYEVGTSISLAAVPALGIGCGILIAWAASVSVWLIKPRDGGSWQKRWTQLLFNTGMHTISLFFAGTALLWLSESLDSILLVGDLLPWLLAAITYSLINTWLLIFIIRLQNGSQVDMLQLFADDLWASSIDVLIMSVGGGLLAYAIENYDLMGIIIFFLPILLSAFAFRLYVHQMRAHLDNLESIIADRTASLEQLMAEKDQFLGVLTHDMKSPLTTINLYGQMLSTNPGILAKKPQIAASILESQKKLREIVDNILDLEELQDEGKMKLNRGWFFAEPELNSILDSIEDQAANKDLTIERSFHFSNGVISGDQVKLQRVFHTLLSTCARYIPTQGIIGILGYEDDEWLIVEIVNHSQVISEEYIPLLFDRFRGNEDYSQVSPSTSLGLAITKAFIDAHQGTIEVTSHAAFGTRVIIKLPLPSEKVLPPLAPSSSKPADSASTSSLSSSNPTRSR